MKTGHGALPRPEPSGGVLAHIWPLTLVVGWNRSCAVCWNTSTWPLHVVCTCMGLSFLAAWQLGSKGESVASSSPSLKVPSNISTVICQWRLSQVLPAHREGTWLLIRRVPKSLCKETVSWPYSENSICHITQGPLLAL